MSKLTRRDFTKIATAASVSTALGSGRALGANDRVRLGFIGVGNRGDQVLDGFLAHKDAEVVAVCDIHQPYMDFAAKKTGGSPRQFKDYRKLLEMKDVDAVVIATPDHWHALQMIHACQAGKDVYVEKPLSLAVAESAVQQEPRLLSLPLVLRLFRRATHEHGRSLYGLDSLGARPRRAGGGYGDGWQIRCRRQSRNPGHARSHLAVSKQSRGWRARQFHTDQRQRAAGQRAQLRRRISRHERRALPDG